MESHRVRPAARMNWEALGAIGQLLGSMAVFVTLAYLAIQVKHARQETRRALSQGRSEAHRDLLAQQLDDKVLDAWVKVQSAFGAPTAPFPALLERAGLTLDEATRVNNMCVAWWTSTIQIIPYVDELPPMERIAFENRVRGQYGSPGAHRLFYETYLKPSAHPDALRYIESILAKPS